MSKHGELHGIDSSEGQVNLGCSYRAPIDVIPWNYLVKNAGLMRTVRHALAERAQIIHPNCDFPAHHPHSKIRSSLQQLRGE